MDMLLSADNEYLYSSKRTVHVHVYVYDLTLTYFQQKGPTTIIQDYLVVEQIDRDNPKYILYHSLETLIGSYFSAKKITTEKSYSDPFFWDDREIIFIFAYYTKEKEHQITRQSDLYFGTTPPRTNLIASCVDALSISWIRR
jgi:hypothetical protein